jgi:hypothetical protein
VVTRSRKRRNLTRKEKKLLREDAGWEANGMGASGNRNNPLTKG